MHRASLSRARPLLLAAAFACAACTTLVSSRPAHAASDPHAVAWARELLDALGGQKAWDGLRTVRWTFTVVRNDTVLTSRTHYWNKQLARDRVEGKTRDGKAFVALVDLDHRTADAWLDGARQAGADSAKWAERGYGLWVNDSYWVFAPYKLLDPGVTLADAGDTTEVGVRYHRIRVSFAQVGLTPGDTYWIYVNASSHLMEKWAYILEKQSPPPTVWWWDEWRKIGPLQLASQRRNPSDPVRLEMRDLAYLPDLLASVFSSPAPVPAGR